MSKINYTEVINSRVKEINFVGEPKELYEPISYILNLKSKRIRPILSMLSFSLFDNNIKKIIDPSIAIEFFHNFTLIHDDIMDNADIRRGYKTIHKKWNKNIGILSGDLLMIFAYKMLENIKDKNFKSTISRFNQIAIQVCEGQQLDMNYESSKIISEEEYLNMIKLKTAVLIGFSLELGGIIAGQDKKTSGLLYEIGEHLGISFQLMDDYLDVFGGAEFGKKIGGDISSNKKTYLMIKLLEKADSSDKKIILGWIENNSDDTKKIKIISELMKKYSIDKIAINKIELFFDRGYRLLDSIPSEKEKITKIKEYFKKLKERKV